MDIFLNPTFIPDSQVIRKKERAFELSLPAVVKGVDATEAEFAERTEISSLSAQEAVLWLSAKVTIGTKLALHLQIPRTFLLEKPLELRLAGTVQYVRSELSRNKKSQLVSVRLDRSFRIDPQVLLAGSS
jgi:hypothetical protein